jgi:hypothetical protein
LSEQIFRVNKTKGCETAVLRPQQAQISKPMLRQRGITGVPTDIDGRWRRAHSQGCFGT